MPGPAAVLQFLVIALRNPELHGPVNWGRAVRGPSARLGRFSRRNALARVSSRPDMLFPHSIVVSAFSTPALGITMHGWGLARHYKIIQFSYHRRIRYDSCVMCWWCE